MKTYQEKQTGKLERFLATLTSSSEAFGLVGRGFPNSFYKVYVRPTQESTTWWIFGASAGPSRVDPIKAQARIPIDARVTAVWCAVRDLGQFRSHPEYVALAKLLERARTLVAGNGVQP